MKNIFRLIKIILITSILAFFFYFVPNRQLNVDYISQYPNMPNGCEITSLTMVMNHYGYKVSKEYLYNNFLEKSGYHNANPDKAYIGNAYKNGYYCYANPIANSANKYFQYYGVNAMAEDVTGISIFGVLNNIIFHKKPVIVWYTVDDNEPIYGKDSYIDELGNRQQLYSNLHCIVVEGVGYGNIKVVDPIKGKRNINAFEFIKIFNQMDSRAVVVN